MSKHRLDWIDSWKGMLIFLVVLGHVSGAALHMNDGRLSGVFAQLYKFIYFFHMPAFFYLVGVCWHHNPEGAFGDYFKAKVRRLLVPYLVFGIASVSIYWIARLEIVPLLSKAPDLYYRGLGYSVWWHSLLSLFHAGGWPNGEGFRCNSVLWFLPVMFCVSIAYWAIDRWMPRRWHQLWFTLGLLVVEFVRRKFWIVYLPWGIDWLCFYLCFVIWGRWMRTTMSNLKLQVWTVVVGWCGLIVFAVVTPDFISAWRSVIWYCVFTCIALYGTIVSMLTAQLVPQMNLVGRASLGIMLTHKFLVVACQPFISSIVGCFGVSLGIICVCYYLVQLIGKVTPWMLGGIRNDV